jgi:hypothetical protein
LLDGGLGDGWPRLGCRLLAANRAAALVRLAATRRRGLRSGRDRPRRRRRPRSRRQSTRAPSPVLPPLPIGRLASRCGALLDRITRRAGGSLDTGRVAITLGSRGIIRVRCRVAIIPDSGRGLIRVQVRVAITPDCGRGFARIRRRPLACARGLRLGGDVLGVGLHLLAGLAGRRGDGLTTRLRLILGRTCWVGGPNGLLAGGW